MSVVAPGSCSITPNLVFDHSSIRTIFWGVTCCTGLRYNQVVEKKYCITQAVLDPHSDTSTDYVLVMFQYKNDDFILAVLRHGLVNQVNLNLHFDREDVTFYLKGKGTVHLLGYEILESSREAYSTRNPATSSAILAGLSSKIKKLKEEQDTKSKPETVTPKSNNKVKSPIQCVPESPEPESPQPSCSKDSTNKLMDLGNEDEDDDDEDDDDFSIADEEDDEADDSEDDVNEEIEDSEIEKLEEDLEDMDELPEPSSSRRKRKEEEVEQPQKRRKTETGSSKKKAQTVVVTDNDKSSDSESELSELDSASDVEQTPPSKKPSFAEDKSAEKLKIIGKMKKKPEKKKNDLVKLNKSQQTTSLVSKTMDSGLEVEDIKIGHGPTVIKGKMLHVYYVGRLSDKSIFDSRTRGSKPFSFVFGSGKVIKGWEIGLEGMKAGGKRRLKVPPSLGYGKTNVEGIPINSTLFFVVEVVAVSN